MCGNQFGLDIFQKHNLPDFFPTKMAFTIFGKAVCGMGFDCFFSDSHFDYAPSTVSGTLPAIRCNAPQLGRSHFAYNLKRIIRLKITPKQPIIPIPINQLIRSEAKASGDGLTMIATTTY
jgi:hypothetical protein